MKKNNPIVGFIGCGHMGSSIVAGILAQKLVPPRQVMVSDQDTRKAVKLAKQFHVSRSSSNQALVRRADIVVLAIKPQDLETLAREIRPFLHSSQMVLSILA